MEKITLGFAMCGSFCTFERVLAQLEPLRDRFGEIVPILSAVSYETDSRFGPRQSFIDRIEAICGHEIIHTIPAAEPIGPKKLLDALVIAPCTGNTLAKLAAGEADSAVTLACKPICAMSVRWLSPFPPMMDWGATPKILAHCWRANISTSSHSGRMTPLESPVR